MKTDELTMQFDEQLIDLTHLYHALNRYPLTVDPNSYLLDAIGMMYQARLEKLPLTNLHSVCKTRNRDLQKSSCILVVEGQKVLGILTQKDIVRLTASGLNFSQVKIAQVMTQPVVTMKLSNLQDVMTVLTVLDKHQICHLPIVDDEENLVGIVTASDLLQGLYQFPLVGVLEALHQSAQASYYPITKTKTLLPEIHELYSDPAFWQEEITDCQVAQKITERKLMEAALRESEDKFRYFAENTHALFWMSDLDLGKNFYVNPAYEKIWGRSCESLIEQPTSWLESLHPEDRDRIIDKIERQKRGETTSEEYRIFRPDGMMRWIWDRGFPICDVQGQIYAYGGVAEDITERKQIEESLRQSEERLSLALESGGLGIFDWNLLTKETLWSPNMGLLYGLSEGAICPVPEVLLNLIHPEDRISFKTAVKNSIEQHQELAIAYRVIWPDNSIHWLSSRGQTYYNEIGQPVRMVGTTRDITERQQAEQKIREQAALLDIATDAIFVQDLDDHILYWNQGAERLYGWSKSEVLGKTSQDLFYAKHALETYQTAFTTVINTGVWQGELPQITKSRQEMIVESRWTLMQDSAGNPKSILIVNTDITQKKQLEEQFLRTQRLESLGTLAGGIAHDLNNILTPILAAAQLLKNKTNPKLQRSPKLDTTPSQHLLDIIENNARRGAGLVKQVLSFARGCQGENSIVQLKHLISDIVLIGKQTFPKSIEFITKLPENLGFVRGDATQLHQVLMNLVVNARDAMPEGGKITISAENIFLDQAYAKMNINAKVGHYILVKVKDTGMGMPPKILDRIFEPFFTTKEIGIGTGLGLSTVLGITKSHGGFVTVTSKVSQGSQFNLFLPAVQTTPEITPEDNTAPQGNGELILVVDDEVKICEIVEIILEQHNYQTLTAHNGIEAIALYAQHKRKISAIVMDMMMPEMDGLTTIRTVQKMNPKAQIIACSGQHSPEALAELSSINIHHILPKPFTAQELLTSLHNAIR